MSTREVVQLAAGDRGTDQTFHRTSIVLNLLAKVADEGLRFTDLQEQTGFSKATLHRLLAGLVNHGFVDFEQPGSRYYPGFCLGLWASAARNRYGFAQRIAPIIRALSEQVEDTAYLSIKDKEMAVCVVLHEGTGAVRALPLSPGDRSALGVGSAASAILATIQDEQEIEAILASPTHIAYCERRGIGRDHICKHLQRTRELGYSYIDDLNPDMTGIAMALNKAAGSPIAAISVATVHSKIEDLRRREHILTKLRDAVAEANEIIGN
ncbi:IclR family transcriptional regulator [Candidimonas sp. SYP-B2681]|uniref:IclR family transcriptional regulator n=1 Tax=Candidimonas sp. SYP-B2681 TaxID=2497686 RepID=UPI000F85FA75|nr:IclR family transcriptional regulator [Candidimonas sp. SYP-B2681]RTZ48215.1 IclR family transcriptional regulator [Candidimonas sp. SYP-B2681]